jgi:hypothetical protein
MKETINTNTHNSQGDDALPNGTESCSLRRIETMADNYGFVSSSVFRVKDRKAFMADPEVKFIKDYARSKNGFFESSDHRTAFFFGWKEQYPSQGFRPGSDISKQFEITDVIQRHIVPGDVCEIHIGYHEPLRRDMLTGINGNITWVTSKGSAFFDGFLDDGRRISASWLKSDAARLARNIASITEPCDSDADRDTASSDTPNYAEGEVR